VGGFVNRTDELGQLDAVLTSEDADPWKSPMSMTGHWKAARGPAITGPQPERDLVVAVCSKQRLRVSGGR
jgi:hypothetical protein